MSETTYLGAALATARFDEAEFEHLFERLGAFFRRRGDRDPEGGAGETILRAVKRLTGGAHVEDFGAYSYGIASKILREQWKARRREAPPDDLAFNDRGFLGLTACERNVLLEQCLRALPQEDRLLLREYYSRDREGLAQESSCSPNALRIRVCRALGAVRRRVAGAGVAP
jgi:DNA-directed RNA polymerase specialized sigma24 family protein